LHIAHICDKATISRPDLLLDRAVPCDFSQQEFQASSWTESCYGRIVYDDSEDFAYGKDSNRAKLERSSILMISGGR